MLVVLAGLVIWIPALLGWGDAVLPAILGGRLREDDEAGLAVSGFAGLGVLAALGAALNLLTGLGPRLSVVVALVGLALFARQRAGALRRLSRGDVAALGALLVLLALIASGPIRLYDTGLYHMQAVAWTTAGPIPAGLANLHRRFGFDTLWYPTAGLLELPGFAQGSASLAPSLALFFFGAASWAAGRRAVAGTAGAAGLLLAFGVVPLAILATAEGIPSLSTDVPTAVLTILSAHFLLRPSPTRAEKSAAVALAFFAVTVKLSAAVFLLAVLLAVRVVPWLLLPAGIAWVTRGIALSGYLLYPAVATRLSFLPWATPPSIARDEAMWVRSWARIPLASPEMTLSGWGWLGIWARATVGRLSVLPLVLLLLAGLAGLLLARRRPADPVETRSALATLAAALASTLFWIASAPDPRFGYGALFVLAAVPLASALPRLGLGEWPARVRIALAGVLGAGLGGAGILFLVAGAGFRPAWLVPAGAPRAAVEGRRTQEGETVWVPVGDNRCWGAPLPCTPYLRDDLLIARDAGGRPRVFSFPPGGSAETHPPRRVPK